MREDTDIDSGNGDKGASSINVRRVMDVLLDISEEQSTKELSQSRSEVLFESLGEDQENARLNGWLTPPRNAQKRSTNNEQKKRRSNPYTGAADIDDFYLFRKKPFVVLPDYWHPGVMWRSIVESDTYRYVADNGCYRYLKTNAALGKHKVPVDEKLHYNQRKPTNIGPFQREIQREITRDLRRIVESHDKQAPTTTPKDEGDVTPSGIVDEKLGDPEDPEPVSEDVRNIPGARLREAEQNGAESPFTLPSMDVPLLSKAFAERLMENFSSKISALEEQIRKDAKLKMLQKSTENTQIGQFRKSSLQDNVSAINPSSHPGLDRKGSFPQSTFQVIKVYTGAKKSEPKHPLKPLEKVTPSLRQTEDTHNMQVAHLRYNSLKGTSENSTPCSRYSFSDSVIHPVYRKDIVPSGEKFNSDDNVTRGVKSVDTGFSTQSLSHPASAKKKNISKPKRSKSFINEADEKNLDGYHTAPAGKPKRDSKKSAIDAQDVTHRVLPGLMGKKMPVTVSVQKWL